MSQPLTVFGDGTKVLLGRGAVYVDRLTSAGLKTGERFLGNCSAFELSGSEELREIRTSVDATNGILARVPVARSLELGITLTEFEQHNLALAFMGDAGFYPAQTTTAITAEIITPAGGCIQGRWYKTSKRNLVTITNVFDDGAPVTEFTGLVRNWEIDMKGGRVYVAPGGSIADGSVVTITATPAAITATEIPLVTPVTAGAIKGLVRFVGDPVNGKIQEYELWSCQLSPDGALPLIGEEFGEFRIKGTVLSDAVNNPASPFGRVLVRPN